MGTMTAEKTEPGRRGPKPQSEHGTYARAKRHKRDGEPLCDPCAEALREYQREAAARSRHRRKAKLEKPGPRTVIPEGEPPPSLAVEPHPCGTTAAAARHRKKGEPLCEPCRLAEREYHNAYRAERRGDH